MSSHYIPLQDPFSQPQKQQPQQQQQHSSPALDFFSFTSPSDILAPHPDLFESELDLSLAGFDQLQLQLLAVDQPDPVYFRGENPACGPPSTITVSSESASAYESLSSASELYNYNTPTTYSFPLDIDMHYSRVGYGPINNSSGLAAIDAISDRSYASSDRSPSSTAVDDRDLASFGSLPSSPHVNGHGGSTYSDFSSGYYPPVSNHPSLDYPVNNTVSPSSISQSHSHHHSQVRATSPQTSMSIPYVSMVRNTEARRSFSSIPQTGAAANISGESMDDPRKKYACNQCNRSFARAFNLKTHMETHDPNRRKPHVCPHPSCQRSFSRKHDLGRHLISIHRDEPNPMGTKIGLAGMKDGRAWCDSCGKSNSQNKKTCSNTCNHVDVK